MADLQLQALYFQADLFTEAEAVAWAKANNHKSDTVRFREEDELITHFIIPQFDPIEGVSGSWKTATETFPPGVSGSLCARKESVTDKAFATFTVKSYDEETRTIRGIASTPSTDREGDIVMPKGASFTLPFPLLANHDHSLPVGMVTRAEIADDGIFIEAQIAKDSGLAYIERTYRQVKASLLRGLSIGFRATKSKATATGRIFEKFEILELSLVAIAANAEATVTSVKQYDGETIEVSEEQLLEREAKRLDVRERARAVLEKSKQTLNSKGN